MRTLVGILVSLLLASCRAGPPEEGSGDPQGAEGASLEEVLDDPEVARIYRAMMDTLAPDRGWERTRYLAFDWLVGRENGWLRRSHRWDRVSGDYRVEAPIGEEGDTMVALFNVTSPTQGERVWVNGEPVTDAARADSLARRAHAWFINDSYWLLMPYKWADPGVSASYLGTTDLWGETYETVELTFDEGVGLTPQNRYRAYVDPESGVMEIWQYFRQSADTDPGFTLAWTDWQDYGPILLSSRRENEDGDARIWFENLRAETSVPDGAFDPPGGA
ncbi:MAG: hypothetical protein GWM92_18865 [Gemmatimonadetes bacterium]|nr:hypothetical protein [Gemmatimonadota bacterium]NIR80864.1 hypothetical protein [Gemmatimonadota bacterium]NIT89683.1 hypothetical protein [Gemmatimonadota bacterium]NIU33463.1 hypothetical protein [Gemmatimonadota bacterium]NIU37749.1 hypothetical protein [Gemmatimonadota bacterium]